MKRTVKGKDACAQQENLSSRVIYAIWCESILFCNLFAKTVEVKEAGGATDRIKKFVEQTFPAGTKRCIGTL